MKNYSIGGQPCGLVVKFSAVYFSSLGSVPRHGPTPLVSGHAVEATHIQNRGRLPQMLTQGKSPSEKKKIIVCGTVRIIFLKTHKPIYRKKRYIPKY